MRCRADANAAADNGASKRLTKASEQGATSKTVRLYGETVQRSYEGFVRRY
jgi:hypothetical protein